MVKLQSKFTLLVKHSWLVSARPVAVWTKTEASTRQKLQTIFKKFSLCTCTYDPHLPAQEHIGTSG